MRIRRATASDMPSLGAMPSCSVIASVDAERFAEDVAAGRMRPEWAWLAVSDDGALLGRALWWGHSHGDWPVALDVLDVAGSVDRVDVAEAMLTHGHLAFLDGGAEGVPEYLLRLPPHWRELSEVRQAVAWRVAAARSAGLTEHNERLQFEWRAGAGVPAPPGRLRFREGNASEFLDLFRRVAVNSLDVTTQRSLTVMDPVAQAQDDYDFYLGSSGERSWWRIATDDAGEELGFIIPSATPYARNVGYLGVLPEHRGRGLVHELLAEITRFHASAGAERITATTDVTNKPMAAAFPGVGFRITERRLVLEPRRSTS